MPQKLLAAGGESFLFLKFAQLEHPRMLLLLLLLLEWECQRNWDLDQEQNHEWAWIWLRLSGCSAGKAAWPGQKPGQQLGRLFALISHVQTMAARGVEQGGETHSQRNVIGGGRGHRTTGHGPRIGKWQQQLGMRKGTKLWHAEKQATKVLKVIFVNKFEVFFTIFMFKYLFIINSINYIIYEINI